MGLLKGAIRRVFSRSELRKRVIAKAVVDHRDPSRPRVTKWVRCNQCKQVTPAYLAEVDHLIPIVKIEEIGYNIDCNTLVDRIWCSEDLLQVLDKTCHAAKTKAENAQRRLHKKRNK